MQKRHSVGSRRLPGTAVPRRHRLVRLITALAALNAGVDWRGVTVPGRTRFVIRASVHTAAADTSQELSRAGEKARAGAHFLVTDVIYDVSPALRLLRELRGRGVGLPVIAAFAPFGDPKAITRRTTRSPGLRCRRWRDGTRASDDADPADPVSAVLDGINGVLIHPPEKAR